MKRIFWLLIGVAIAALVLPLWATAQEPQQFEKQFHPPVISPVEYARKLTLEFKQYPEGGSALWVQYPLPGQKFLLSYVANRLSSDVFTTSGDAGVEPHLEIRRVFYLTDQRGVTHKIPAVFVRFVEFNPTTYEEKLAAHLEVFRFGSAGSGPNRGGVVFNVRPVGASVEYISNDQGIEHIYGLVLWVELGAEPTPFVFYPPPPLDFPDRPRPRPREDFPSPPSVPDGRG